MQISMYGKGVKRRATRVLDGLDLRSPVLTIQTMSFHGLEVLISVWPIEETG